MLNWKRIYTKPEFWVGIIVTLLGTWHTLNSLDLIPEISLETDWPAMLILAGSFQLASSKYRDIGGSCLVIAVGAGLLLYNNGFFQEEMINTYWPESLIKLLRTILDLANAASTILVHTTGASHVW